MANWDAHNRALVDEGRQALERTSASLARSNRIAIETEEIGTNVSQTSPRDMNFTNENSLCINWYNSFQVINDLSEQRESLLRSQRRLENANDGLSKSGQILRSMRQNVFYNKLLLILIITLEVLILGALLFVKFFKK